MKKLEFHPLEYVSIGRPYNRIDFLVDAAKDQKVLDLGCWDETALNKHNSDFWLHRRIAASSAYTIGIDSSEGIPEAGYSEDKSTIIKGDVTLKEDLQGRDIDLIIAGELIEHLPNTLEFFCMLKEIYGGKRLVCTTPNATNLSNVLLAIARRESMHHDHLNIYSFKTLYTLSKKAGFSHFKIHPYYVSYPEMILRNKGLRRSAVQLIQKSINLAEYVTPMWAGGLILDVTL